MIDPPSARHGRKSRGAIYTALEEGIEQLQQGMGGLPAPADAEGLWGDIWYQETHNSTALEGNTLVLKEVEVLLHDGRPVGEKPLSDYLEVQGYAEAARWVYSQGRGPSDWSGDALLTMTEVRYIHQLALEPVWTVQPHPNATDLERPGNFRRHDIRPFPGGMRPPSWPDVPSLLYDWLAEVITIAADPLPFPEALAARHAAFERIHPFLDGNGRAGRLLTNLVLVRLGYPPAIIRKRDRDRYLRALRRADQGDPGQLGELFARAILDTLYRFITPVAAERGQLVPLVSLEDAELSANTLRQAASRGRLKAQRDRSGRWLSSREWVEEYKRSRSKAGRKPAARHARLSVP